MKKTQKSFRKKALLSSLSMLMVATIAVGSATFAWFTSDPTAKADGVNIKSTASEGLLINAAQEGKWTHNATIAKTSGNQILAPASFNLADFNGAAYTVKAKADDNYVADDAAAVTTGGASYSEEIAAKITGVAEGTEKSVKVTGVTITNNDLAGDVKTTSAAVRVLITFTPDGGTESLLGVWANETSNKYLTGEGQYSTVLSSAEYSFKTGASDTVTVGTDGNDKFKVYLYLDGESANCYSQNIPLNQLGAGIQINFAIAS